MGSHKTYDKNISLQYKQCFKFNVFTFTKEFLCLNASKTYGLGAKIKKNRSVALPRKKNFIAIMHQVYISGAWKSMFD